MVDRAPIVIAHRTCPNHAPENSLLGIRRAAELGADVVEVDVRLTLDGRPVLMHDRSLRRTAALVGPPYLRRESAITGREIGDGERVPTFAEALAALPPGLRMAVDVKVPRALHPVLSEIVRQDAGDRVMLWSKQASVIKFTATNHPQIEGSLVRHVRTDRGRRALVAAARRCAARGISIRWDAVTAELVDAARADGLRLYAVCADAEPPAEALAWLDGITTEWPEHARATIDAA